MEPKKLIAVDSNAKPWEERFNEPTGKTMYRKELYIDPETCIDCGACVPVCPVQAIFPAEEVPEKWKHYTQMEVDWYAKRK